MLKSSLPLFAAAALFAEATPIRLVLRDLWTTTNCTGTTEGDTTLVPAIPTDLIDYLESELKAQYSYIGSESDATLSHASFCTSANDTSVFKVVEGASLKLDYVNLLKYGYSLDLNQASFFGVNAMVNVANGSSLTATHVNMTSHNGAAGLYSYGTGTKVETSDTSFYATGPVSHGVYAAGNGTANATNFNCLTEGYRSSCFSGDSPAGYMTIRDSEAYTYGLGSAVMYTLGEAYLYNVKGYADKSPWQFMDGSQVLHVDGCDLEGGNLGGGIFFSSQGTAVARANISNSILRAHGENASGIAVAGTTAELSFKATTFITESGVVISSNSSLIPQSFDRWTSPAEAPFAVNPATAHIYISESQINGDMLAINGSKIDLYLSEYSVWQGKVVLQDIVENGAVGVYLDENSAWSLTGDSYVQNFTISSNDLSNIESNGYSIYYNQSQPCNSWISSNATLNGGGMLVAY